MHADAALQHAVRAAEPVAVREFGARDTANWDAFVAHCPDATFFHRVGWREIIEEIFGHRCHYLVAERDGRLTGVLPLAAVRSRLFGHSLVSLPFAVYDVPG